MIIIKGKIEKTIKAQCKFSGEELLGPPSQFESYSLSASSKSHSGRCY